MKFVDTDTFLKAQGSLIDVRSPCEYRQGKIPGAINLPLFSDTERSLVGTKYQREGTTEAMSLGLKFIAPKLSTIFEKASELSPDGITKIHCWRGGLRSTAVATFLEEAGISCFLLEKGYKSFRRWANELFRKPFDYRVVGGLTGSGKTEMLHALRKQGEQVLDFEALAQHKGSSFGHIGMPFQPTTEQFQNEIALLLSSFTPKRPVWVEDESRTIGTCHIPEELFSRMESSPLYFIERPLGERLEILKKNYGSSSKEQLISSVNRLKKRLGGVKTKEIVSFIEAEQLKEAAEETLKYYDSTYKYCISKRNQKIQYLNFEGLSNQESARRLLGFL